MLKYDYIKGKFFRFLEKWRNRHHDIKNTSTHYPTNLWSWCGIDHIYLSHTHEKNRLKLITKYTALKGALHQLNIHSATEISYPDHVSRIQTPVSLGEARFIKPRLSITDFTQSNILKLKSVDNFIRSIAKRHPQLSVKPEAFQYEKLETEHNLHVPVCVGLPSEFQKNYILNEHDEITANVLHLPIKVSRTQSIEFNTEGRTLSDKSKLNHHTVYLPKELSYLLPLIEHISAIETEYNPLFLEDYFIFLSISHSLVQPGTTQRRGGWHIDGHQGYERLQKSGNKLPCDRQYTISNVLPTEYLSFKFNFDSVRDYCKKHFCQLDSVNMQDVIEYQASRYAHSENIKKLPINQLNFLNPYMVHRAAENTSDSPIKRTFIRILCSTYTRNRLGDSINPVFGPLYPMKIKTITDIHEINQQYMQS